jgi:hypothetical protein
VIAAVAYAAQGQQVIFSVVTTTTVPIGVMDFQLYAAATPPTEFFKAMKRLGKRARFAHYWSEGHALISPANHVYVMEQILK